MIRRNIDIAALAVLLTGVAVMSHLWDTVMMPKLLQNQIQVSSGMFHVATVPVCPYLRVVFR